MTAGCPCCHEIGWNPADTRFTCDIEHDVEFDFAGCVMVECPHCADDTPLEPLRPAVESVEHASHLLSPLAVMVLAGKLDDLGMHVAELRQQRALDRLERILGTGHYAIPDYPRLKAVAA